MIKMKTTTITMKKDQPVRYGLSVKVDYFISAVSWVLWDVLAWRALGQWQGWTCHWSPTTETAAPPAWDVSLFGQWSCAQFCCHWVEKDGPHHCWTLLRAQHFSLGFSWWLWLLLVSKKRIHGCGSSESALFSLARWCIVVASSPLLNEKPSLGPSPALCGFVRGCAELLLLPAQPCFRSGGSPARGWVGFNQAFPFPVCTLLHFPIKWWLHIVEEGSQV